MSNYTQTTFFTPKDTLPATDPNKTIFGAAYDVEFGNIQTAINSKQDSGFGTSFASINVTGNVAPANGIYLPSANTLGLASNSVLRVSIASDGGVFLAGATGSSQGSGTINATGLFVNGIPALTAPPGQYAINGNPSASFSSGFGSVMRWTTTECTGAGSLAAGTGSGGNGPAWSSAGSTGGFAGFAAVPGATTIFAASANARLATATGSANQQSELDGGLFGSALEQSMFRLLSPALPVGGFALVWYGGFDSGITGNTMFVGIGPSGAALAGNQVPSAILNCVGFSKDTGDTNIQFIYNNNSGTATKTDTGMTWIGIQDHMLKMYITCDVLGNVVATLTDLESGGQGTVTYNIPTATAKLPVANATLMPRFYISTGTATTAPVKIAFNWISTASGFIA